MHKPQITNPNTDKLAYSETQKHSHYQGGTNHKQVCKQDESFQPVD